VDVETLEVDTFLRELVEVRRLDVPEMEADVAPPHVVRDDRRMLAWRGSATSPPPPGGKRRNRIAAIAATASVAGTR
jgi:hypothetical protein